MQILIDLLHFLTPYGHMSYAAMFLLLLACGFGLPMPEDIILVTGGILAASGIVDPYITIVLCICGVLCGDGAIFFIGRRFGPAIKTAPGFRRLFTPKRDAKVSQVFQRYGDKVIFMARFMPGLRMPIFMTTGAYQVPPWKFFLLDGFAALISVPVWVYLGFLFGDNLELLERKIRHLQTGMFLGLIGIAVAVIAYFKLRRKKSLTPVGPADPTGRADQAGSFER